MPKMAFSAILGMQDASIFFGPAFRFGPKIGLPDRAFTLPTCPYVTPPTPPSPTALLGAEQKRAEEEARAQEELQRRPRCDPRPCHTGPGQTVT